MVPPLFFWGATEKHDAVRWLGIKVGLCRLIDSPISSNSNLLPFVKGNGMAAAAHSTCAYKQSQELIAFMPCTHMGHDEEKRKKNVIISFQQ